MGRRDRPSTSPSTATPARRSNAPPPPSFTDCTTGGDSPHSESFDSGDRPGGWAYYERGEIETLRVLDVNGTIIIITTRLKPGHQDAGRRRWTRRRARLDPHRTDMSQARIGLARRDAPET